MKKIKRLQILFVCCVLVLTATAVPSHAKNGRENATITYRNIRIFADDELLVPLDPAGNSVEPFVMNATTYLPLRAVGEAVGYEVNWDSQHNIIDLFGKSQTKYTKSTPNTTSKPLKKGDLYIHQNRMDDDIAHIGITMLEILRGSEVTSAFPDILNLGPQTGNVFFHSGITKNQEILAARFRFEFLEGTGWYEKGRGFFVTTFTFKLQAANSPPECKNLNVNHFNTLHVLLKPGGRAEDYVFFFIDKDTRDARIIWDYVAPVYFDASMS